MSEREQRTVECWSSIKGVYVRPPFFKRARGPYPSMSLAMDAAAVDCEYPFAIEFRDPQEVPKEQWPSKRQPKDAESTFLQDPPIAAEG
jgi:hypothetical protein